MAAVAEAEETPAGGFAAEMNSDSEGSRNKSEGQVLWDRTGRIVKRIVRVSMSFRTLRDMCGKAYISPGQLETVGSLGKGAFAVVEQCMYTSLDNIVSPVAVKRLKPSVFQTKRELECFLKEADLLRRLRHICIVGFLGVGITDQQRIDASDWENVYLVQEYMDAGTLKSVVTKQMSDPSKSIYSDAQALEWALQIAKGLRYLHQAKPRVIHRDVKLDNVLLGKEKFGRKLHAKLADFGLHALIHAQDVSRRMLKPETHDKAGFVPISTPLSRVSKMRSLKASYTLSGRTGSLLYMAPEVYQCLRYNEKCDIFSFAIIMYELFQRTIILAFASTTGDSSEVISYVQGVAQGSRPSIPEEWPLELRSLIESCWAQNFHDRPTMTQVVEQLQALKSSGVFAESSKDPENDTDDEDNNQSAGMKKCRCCSVQ
ncbi:hypothetical protein BSKO_03688 [Bryopsis sp. KO-2023]|nr:hypothetical protein BSKO_03688 [Bryopsis sp. KO-2023]